MRCIDADALKQSFVEDGHLSAYIEEFIDNVPTIDAEPVQQGWISVKDRLPERLGLSGDEVEYVLVYEKGVLAGFHGYENVSVCAYGKNGWEELDSFGLIDVNNITHWMMPYPKLLSAKMN